MSFQQFCKGIFDATMWPNERADLAVDDVTDELKAAARAGKNVVAVHVHQTSGGQYIDVGLVLDPEGKLLAAPKPRDPAEIKRLSDARWPAEKARRWFDEQPWPCGLKVTFLKLMEPPEATSPTNPSPLTGSITGEPTYHALGLGSPLAAKGKLKSTG